MTDIQQLKKDRFRFLHRLYERTGGSPREFANMWEIGNELGFDRKYTDDIMMYLSGELLAELKYGGGGIAITHYGRKEVEEALQEPDQPTNFPPPINVIQIGSMEKSQIVQGSTESVVSQQPEGSPSLDERGRLWYQQPTVIAAIVTGVFLIIAAIIGKLSCQNFLGLESQTTKETASQDSSDNRVVPIREGSASELISYLQSLPPLQRDGVIDRNYIGRWVNWSGTVEDISVGNDRYQLYCMDLYKHRLNAVIEFPRESRAQIERLRPGDSLEYTAQIKTLDLGSVRLHKATIDKVY